MPKIIDHAAREVDVAEAAWRVVLERGIQGLSVRTVAAEAGLATGSLRRTFPTQQDLLIACIRLVEERARARISALPHNADPADRTLAALCETLPLDEERRAEMEVWLALSVGSLTDATLSAECARIDAAIGKLSASVTATLLPDASPDDLKREAAHLHALIDGLAMHLVKHLHPTAAEGNYHETDWAVQVVRAHLDTMAR